jgi:transposase
MEATGRYGNDLAHYLYEAGHPVSVVNPKWIKDYAGSQGMRNKTDRADARLIAQYCDRHELTLWTPPDPLYVDLQATTRRLKGLKDMRQQERNRLKSAPPSNVVRDDIKQHIAQLEQRIERLDRQIQDFIKSHPVLLHQCLLLKTITGIGLLTAAILIAEIQDINRFENADQLAAYAGLTPSSRQSGSSLNTQARLSKAGRSEIRAALYFPTLNARRFNPIISSFCDRLVLNGKQPIVAIGAAMHKLIRIVYGVLKHQQPFDPHYLEKSALSA